MSKQYKTVYQVCDGANFPAFNTLAEAEAYLTKMDRVDSGLTAYAGHPDGAEVHYWVSLYDDRLPDRYTQADLERCVGEGDSCPQIRPVAVLLDYEPDNSPATAPRIIPEIDV